MGTRSKLGQFKSDLPSRTVQSFREESSPGKIIGSAMKAIRPDPRIPQPAVPAGKFSGPGSVPGSFFDSTQFGDFHLQMNRVAQAKMYFDSTPLRVRQHFGFRAEKFIEAILDPAQAGLLAQLGVLKVRENPSSVVSQPAPVEPVVKSEVKS